MLKNKLFLVGLIILPLSACFSISPWSKIREYSDSKSSAKEQGGGQLSQFQDIIKMAEDGLAPAQYNLGDMYLEGQGAPKDVALGAKWHRKAAEQGFPMSQFRLGELYAKGQGVEQDQALSLKWLGKAKAAGVTLPPPDAGKEPADAAPVDAALSQAARNDTKYAGAQYKLSAMYFNGNGVPRDLVLAYMWVKLAAHHGSEEAKRDRQFIASEMTQEQMAKGDELAHKWLQEQAAK